MPAEPPPPAGLVVVDYYDTDQPPPPPIVALLQVPACADASGLTGWVREALGPFGGPDEQSFEVVPLAEVIDVAPVLRDTAPACAIAGRQGDVHAWELRGADGGVLGRGVASEQLVGAFSRVHERQRALGGVNFGNTSPLASGEHVAGVLRGARLGRLFFGRTANRL
ncbi:MAG: hypothetical protein M3276_05630 [Actinomycetota bacterium]|nr:hypothetical protein [Actinomycetota bacterium]